MLSFGSLFAGIGGVDLGFERAGMNCKWQVEIDDYATRILEKHWPNVRRYRDIRDVRKLEYVDVIAGGFPCQDISNAGGRKGITGERSGLWKEYLRVICMVRPRYIIVENVAALTHRGLIPYSGTYTRAGMMRNGIVFRRQPLVPLTDVTGFSLWPTPTVMDHLENLNPRKDATATRSILLSQKVRMWPTPLSTDALKCPSDSLTRFVQDELKISFRKSRTRKYPTPTSRDWRTGSQNQEKRCHLNDIVSVKEKNNGKLNPGWVEWLMGFPIGWTELNASETQSSRKSLSLSGKE